MKITQELFSSVFGPIEKMPRNKEEFMQRLFFFYEAGRKDKQKEMTQSLVRSLNKIIEGGEQA